MIALFLLRLTRKPRADYGRISMAELKRNLPQRLD